MLRHLRLVHAALCHQGLWGGYTLWVRNCTALALKVLSMFVVMQVRPEVHAPGQVLHTVGYPLDQGVYGGSFLYHMSDRRIALG